MPVELLDMSAGEEPSVSEAPQLPRGTRGMSPTVDDGGWADGAWSRRPWAGGSVVSGVWLGGLSQVESSDHELIDLGEAGPVEEPLARPTFTRGRILTGLVVGCLLLLSGASVAKAERVVLLWTVPSMPGAHLLASQHGVFVVQNGSSPMVAAVEAETGRQWWQSSVPWTPDRFLDVGDGVDAVIVRTTIVDSRDGPRMEQTEYVRRADGHVLGAVSGAPLGRSGRVVVQVAYVRCPGATAPSCPDVSGWDVAASREVWHLSLPSGTRVFGGGLAAGRFITSTGDGAMTLRSAVSGLPVADRPGTLTGGGGYRLNTVVGDILIVGVAGTESSTFTGLRASTMQQLWSVEVERDTGGKQVDTTLVDLTRCGGSACVIDGGGTAVLNPATGVIRFRTDLDVIAQVRTGAFLAVPYLGHLDPTGRFVSDVLALDPATGAVTATASNATPVDFGDETTVSTGLTRRAGDHVTNFATIGHDGSGAALFTVTGADLGCVQVSTMLVCLDPAGVLRGWRVTS